MLSLDMGQVHPETQPLEPLYSLKVAVELIPMASMNALYQFLGRHKAEFPPLYYGNGCRMKRMLRRSELVRIRELAYTTKPHPRSRGPNLIEAIIARATTNA